MESFKNNYLKCGVKTIAMLALLSLVAKPIYATDVPLDLLDMSVVAIGYNIYELNNETGKIEKKREYNGTGVLVLTESGHYVLVTARHVLYDIKGKLLPNLCFWGNKKNGEQFEEFFSKHQEEFKNIKWIMHTKYDIALTIVALDPEEDLVYFVPLEKFESIEDIKKSTEVYYLGYPFGIGAEKGGSPVRRKGMVVYKVKKDNYFYMDAMLASGNSGGPVFKLDEEKKSGKLFGIISGFKSFEKHEKYFHSGLGIVFSADCIKELLQSEPFKQTR